MSALSDEMQAVAYELIAEFGQAVTFKRTPTGDYDPSTSSTAGGVEINYGGFAVPLNYTAFELGAKLLTQQDSRLMVNKTNVEPLVGDIVTVGAKAYRVLGVDKQSLNGSDIYYDLQVRI